MINEPKTTPEPIARASTLKRVNLRRFLEELRRRGPSTRADLVRATGVSAPTSSTIISDLMAAGFLEEMESHAGNRGRPGKLFRLAVDHGYVIGITVEPRACLIAVAGLDGIVHPASVSSFQTPASYEELLDEIAGRVIDLTRRRTGRCIGIGVSLPGLVREHAKTVAMSPNLHLTDGKAVGADLSERLGLDVFCIQEEHALCLAEQRRGNASGLANFAVIDITYGMGMGVVCAGSYVTGQDGFAGEIGHVIVEPDGLPCGCGNRGCFETVATDWAFLQAVGKKIGRCVDFEDIARLGGEQHVKPELDRTLDYVALAMATVINLFNPEAVFVKSRMFELDPDALPRLSTVALSRALAPSRQVAVLPVTASRIEGVFAGLLDQVFARVGPALG